MNTITVILLAASFVLAFIGLAFVIKQTLKVTGFIRAIYIVGVLLYVGIIGLSALALLNVYGVARLPVINEMNKRQPQTYSAPELESPPVAAPVQPSLKPTIEQVYK